MPRWKVRVRRIETSVVEVEADDYFDAASMAKGLVCGATLPLGTDVVQISDGSLVDADADVIAQLGEPWVAFPTGGGWYSSADDVVVLKRAVGNRFTAEDVALLQSRIESTGLEVIDSWNGDGYSTVSFRCKGRLGTEDMSAEHEAIILAPRAAQ